MEQLVGRTAVVTGGGSGIGRAIALALAERGTNIVVADIEQPAAETVAAEVAELGVGALAVRTDVGSLESVRTLADRSFERFGAVDILCNNAGVMLGRRVNIADHSFDDWDWVLRVNLWGIVNGLLAFLPCIREQAGEKHVINVASGAGLMAVPSTSYTASKFAVVGLSETLAMDLGDEGFGVTIVCPAAVATQIRLALRNRPPEHERGPGEAMLPQAPGTPGLIEASDVGRMVADAVQANQLFLLTHEGMAEGVLAHAARIAGTA